MISGKETELEYVLTHTHKKDLIGFLKSVPGHFPELIRLAISDKQPYSWRAAWVLWSCMEKNDQRIRKHVRKILEVLALRKQNQQRELLIALQQMDLDDDSNGRLFGICTTIWKNTGNQSSLRFNAFKALVKICNDHPELNKELRSLMNSRYTHELTENMQRSIHRLAGRIKR